MKALTITSWIAVLTMMAFITWNLADKFEPPYPEPTVRYTAASYKSLEYQHAQEKISRIKAEEFIQELADLSK